MQFIIFLTERVDLRLRAQEAHRKMLSQDLGKASQATIVDVRPEERKQMSQKRRKSVLTEAMAVQRPRGQTEQSAWFQISIISSALCLPCSRPTNAPPPQITTSETTGSSLFGVEYLRNYTEILGA